MKQRVITGALLILLLVVLLWLPGWFMALTILVAIGLCIWEEYHALSLAGHLPVTWPAWGVLVTSIPLTRAYGPQAMIPLMAVAMLLIVGIVLFRKEPSLIDLSLSALPILTVILPGLCLVSLSLAEQKAVEVVLMSLTFSVPLMGDMMALFVGSALGKRKLCPAVSPHKTVAGSVGGLAGSLLAAIVVYLISLVTCNAATLAKLPTFWQYMMLGVLGGIVGQLGDLFASLVKRYSGIKDFSNLFPGHGGMLDRIDSVLFMAVLMICFQQLTA